MSFLKNGIDVISQRYAPPTPTVISDISDTTRINNMAFATYTLSNLLDNYYTVYYNPNTALFTVPIIPNISNFANRYTVGATSITTALSYKKLPFVVTSTLGSYSVNYFNGHYTVILTTDGTYTITFSSAITNMVAYACSAGGNGGGGDYSGGGGDGGGGGSGTVTRGTISLPISAVLTCSLNTSGYYRVTYLTSFISVTNAAGGGNAAGASNGTQGANGVASSAGSSFTSISSSSGASLVTNFGTTAGGYVMHTNASSAIGFGGAGGNGGNGGKYGSSGVALTRDGVGYGAGGGGEVSFEGGPGSGVPGVIILSIPFA